MTFDFDLLVIGAGSGGVRSARVAASLGARVAVVEQGKLGGTCVNAGCVPKKLLVYGAELGRALHDARDFGHTVGPSQFAWSALIAAKDREIARLNDAYRRMLESAGVEILAATARVLDAHSVAVGERSVRARYLLIATGGVPLREDVPGAELAITSDEAFHLAQLPNRVVIVGAGYIGLEFASIFHGLGAQVQVVHRGPEVLSDFDRDVREHLAGELRKQGIVLRGSTTLAKIERKSDTLMASLSDGTLHECDQVMLAMGRRPNTRGLGLQTADVALDDDGSVLVDAQGRTSTPNIYAVGDCTNGPALTPVAIADGRAVAQTLFGSTPSAFDHDLVPTAVFTQPPVACVGFSEHEAQQRGHVVDLYRSTFKPLKYSLGHRGERSMMKLVVDRATQRVLGCHMVGTDAPELMQGFAVALRCAATKADFDATIGIHPTSAEEFVTMQQTFVRPSDS